MRTLQHGSGADHLNPSSRAASASSESVATVTRPANSSYFPALDGLRAVAFLMVFAQHYLQMPWGWTGVDVFFVLSGFLITGILYDTRDQPHRVRNFYVRRTLRIFPLYYGLMLLLLLLYPLLRWQWNWSWMLWPAYLGNFCHGIHYLTDRPWLVSLANFNPVSRTFPKIGLRFGHFWSLCVEEQFYLIWPWIVFWVRDRRKLLLACLACILICPLMRLEVNHLFLQSGLDREILYRWTPFRVDALLIGGLVALVRRGPSPGQLRIVARVGFGVLSSVLLVWLALNPALWHWPFSYVYPTWMFTWGLVFVDVYSACLIVMALERDSITFRVFNLRPLRWMGRISYGAYVFHDILHDQYSWLIGHYHVPHARVATPVLAFVCTLLLAWASFRWYETPFIRLKDRWTRSSLRATAG
jgi:peptidoglycan/LPS O-acetylase OafA/YrhL